MATTAGGPGSWSENVLQYFLRNNQITTEDGAQITWYHAANHKAQMKEALKNEHCSILSAFSYEVPALAVAAEDRKRLSLDGFRIA